MGFFVGPKNFALLSTNALQYSLRKQKLEPVDRVLYIISDKYERFDFLMTAANDAFLIPQSIPFFGYCSERMWSSVLSVPHLPQLCVDDLYFKTSKISLSMHV